MSRTLKPKRVKFLQEINIDCHKYRPGDYGSFAAWYANSLINRGIAKIQRAARRKSVDQPRES